MERNLVIEAVEIALYFAIAAALVVFMVFVEILDRIVRSRVVEEKCPRLSKLINNRATNLRVCSSRERTTR